MTYNYDVIDHLVPQIPDVEIPRDAKVREIEAGFGPDCQQQMVVGGVLTGKTTLLSQFIRQHRDRCIAYFITSSPFTQRQHAFLFTMCYQMSMILSVDPPPENIQLEDLKGLFGALSFQLSRKAIACGTCYYFVVDGLDQCLQGIEGDRIIDLFPLQTTSRGVFLLWSCRLDRLDQLPPRTRCTTVDPGEFDLLGTQTYLCNSGFTDDEIERLHSMYHGTPGYLQIIRETKYKNPSFDVNSAPLEIDRLISQQVDAVFQKAAPKVASALEILATSPASIPCQLLADITDSTVRSLAECLRTTALIRFDGRNHRVEFLNDLIRSGVKKRAGERMKAVTRELLLYTQQHYPTEELLLTLLFREAEDYEGLCNTLASRSILDLVEVTGEMSGLLRRVQLASEMAAKRGKKPDLLRWTLGAAVLRTLLSSAASSREIEALLSIGETQQALARTYAIGDITVKIRLLAKVYVFMKNHGDRIPKGALEELTALVENLDLETLDSEVAQEVAVELLPLLPDTAFPLLDRIIERSEKRSIVEVAIGAIEENSRRARVKDTAPKLRSDLAYVAQFLSSWLSELTFSELCQDLEQVSSTEAKEYILRQWCRQNSDSDDLVAAIDLWLEIVIGDRDFIILLRSLRHITALVGQVPCAERKRLVQRLRVPQFTALDSPKEEWIRFHLSLAEALSEIDREESFREVRRVHEEILQGMDEPDVEATCLARLTATINRLFPDEKVWASEVDTRFQAVFRSLLDHSAEQFEPLRQTFRTLAEFDPSYALIAASELNTRVRRAAAVCEVLSTGLRKHSEENAVSFVEDAVDMLTKREKDVALVEITSELKARQVKLSTENVEVLLKHSREIGDAVHKAQALASLAGLLHGTLPERALGLVDEAIVAWKLEDDLKLKLGVGFDMVRLLAELDLDKAKQIYEEVQSLQHQPGFALAAVELGATFKEILDLIIRGISGQHLNDAKDYLQTVEELILQIPSRVVRIMLFAELAASMYRVGYSQSGNDVVRTKVLPELEQLDPEVQPLLTFDYERALEFCLPVIVEFDLPLARELSARLPYPSRDQAWHNAIFWLLSRSFLGDHYFEASELRIKSDRPRLKKAVDAGREITCDILVYSAVAVMANSVNESFDSLLDLTQALDLLNDLDDLAARLPEQSCENIRHEGYRIVAEATVHGVRSAIFRRTKNKRQLTSKEMGARWKDICYRAERIINTADRVLVIAEVAKEMARYYEKDRGPARLFLEKAEHEILAIPTLLDRVDRLHLVSDAWDQLKEKNRARKLIESAFDLTSQMDGASADDHLRLVVQAAYKLDPKLADELTSRLDSRLPGQSLTPSKLDLEVEKLRSNPGYLSQVNGLHEAKGIILGRAARMLIQDFATGRGMISAGEVETWLSEAISHSPGVILRVSHWAVENLNQGGRTRPVLSELDFLVDAANLTRSLAIWIAKVKGHGIPEEIYGSFPGLNTKIVGFRAGDSERAERWLRDWLRENAKDYLKICDPYLGAQELRYLIDVPVNCRISIITTDRYLKGGDNSEQLRYDLLEQWSKLTSREFPLLQLLIVPANCEDHFHDRAIVTVGAGLDIGPSLNGLGRSRQKLTILSAEDAKVLEETYVEKMLNNTTWFMSGCQPTVLFFGVSASLQH